MTRQRLINEIHKLHFEKNEEKDEIMDEIYIFGKYPDLETLYRQYKKPADRWHQLVREVLFSDRQSIRYMYDRTIQLIRRFGGDTESYFEVRTELGTYILPDRLSDLNRLLELYKIFFRDIFLGLTKRINLELLGERHRTDTASGKIQWAATLNDPYNLVLLENPLVFTTIRPATRFDIPENILLVLSILRMHYDSLFLREYNFCDKLSVAEREILEKIAEGCSQALKLSILSELVPQAQKYVFLELSDPRVLSLENGAYSRIRDFSPQNELIKKLLEWRKMYRYLQLRMVSPYRTSFPLDHIENIDTMYELWILFELLDYLRNEGSSITINRFPSEFRVSKGEIEYTLFYEKRYAGWSTVYAVPDFTIEVAGQVRAVMDAKNWLAEDRKDAIYKMLGYMNNLDTPLGVLFFPNGSSLGKERVHYGLGLKHHKNQCLFNCVLYPSSSSEEYKNKIKEFSKLLELIFKHIIRRKKSD